MLLLAMLGVVAGCGSSSIKTDPNGATMTAYVDASGVAAVTACLNPGPVSCGRTSASDACSAAANGVTVSLPFVLLNDGDANDGLFQGNLSGVAPGDTLTIQCSTNGIQFSGSSIIPAALDLTAPTAGETFQPNVPVILSWMPSPTSNDYVSWKATGTCAGSGWTTGWSTGVTDLGNLDINPTITSFSHGDACSVDLEVARVFSGTVSPARGDVSMLAGEEVDVTVQLAP